MISGDVSDFEILTHESSANEGSTNRALNCTRGNESLEIGERLCVGTERRSVKLGKTKERGNLR